MYSRGLNQSATYGERVRDAQNLWYDEIGLRETFSIKCLSVYETIIINVFARVWLYTVNQYSRKTQKCAVSFFNLVSKTHPANAVT